MVASAEEQRKIERGEIRVQLSHEIAQALRVRARTVERSRRKRKVCGDSVARDIEVPGSVHSQLGEQILARSSDQRRMNDRIRMRVPFKNEAVLVRVRACGKVCPGRRRKGGSVGSAREDHFSVGCQQSRIDSAGARISRKTETVAED